jgi:hypothetical protein
MEEKIDGSNRKEAEFPWPSWEEHDSHRVEIQNLVETARGVALILNAVDYIAWIDDAETVLVGLSIVLNRTANAVDVEFFRSLGSVAVPGPGVKDTKLAHIFERELQEARERIRKTTEAGLGHKRRMK